MRISDGSSDVCSSDRLTEERFPGVELDDRWPDDAVAARFPGESTAVVTLSHDIKNDDPALVAALRAPTGYLAELGSRKSHAARRSAERRVGKECGGRCRSRWSPNH